jgi:hypothetical protein
MNEGETMNTQTEPTIVNPMQMTEAYPLEDRSLPADEVIIAQQAESADDASMAPIFVP